VTFTKDRGATLTPTEQTLTPVGYTKGLIALDTPNTLLAEHKGAILRSEDAGCTWSPVGQVGSSPLVLVAAPGGRAYGYVDNNEYLYRIDGDTITKLTSPAHYVLGLGVDPKDENHLRIGDDKGQVWDSKDGGASFSPIGMKIPDALSIYRYGFDPNDLDHILVGQLVKGASVSHDGGATWKSAQIKGVQDANVFSIAISPADANVAWVQGIDLAHANDAVYEGRTIWRSLDGGASFEPMVEQTAEITIRNQELLAPHPTDPTILYFVFGTYYNNYGTDIYRYDATQANVTKTHNDHDDISSIAFHPGNPEVMYLGLTADAVQ